jgi:hypothetical protein
MHSDVIYEIQTDVHSYRQLSNTTRSSSVCYSVERVEQVAKKRDLCFPQHPYLRYRRGSVTMCIPRDG